MLVCSYTGIICPSELPYSSKIALAFYVDENLNYIIQGNYIYPCGYIVKNKHKDNNRKLLYIYIALTIIIIQ